jgi:hypothetical protein
MRDTAETTDKARAELDGISAPSSAVPPLRVAIAGLGTVGTGVLSLLEANRDLIARRAGRPIEAVVVSARDRNKDRGIDLSPYRWDDDMDDLADHADVDAIVELIGGADGPALTLARNALKRGKAFITANKAMIAQHGMDRGSGRYCGHAAEIRSCRCGRHSGDQRTARRYCRQSYQPGLWHIKWHLQLHPVHHGNGRQSFSRRAESCPRYGLCRG